jgi:glycine betaine catabolism A
MADLVTGHRWESVLACNWKSFWENYSECLHCPGIHPELVRPGADLWHRHHGCVRGAGLDARRPRRPNLRPGAQSWTLDGALCGPLSGPDEAERQAGYSFVTLWPSAYVVAHVDYVRAVRLVPLGPEQTRLVAEWYFAPETLAQPGFDAAEVAAFAKIVMAQDAAASEMNQRGIRSPAFTAARLMPEEYEIAPLSPMGAGRDGGPA